MRRPANSKQQAANSAARARPNSKQQTANSKARTGEPQSPRNKPGRQKRTSRIHRAASGPRAQPATDRLRATVDAQAGEEGADPPSSTLHPPPSSARATRKSRGGGSTLHPPPSSARATRPQKDPSEGFIAIGRVLGPFGLHGELKVLPLTDNPARFAAKSRLYAGDQPVTVASSREAAGHLYVTLKGFADRDSTERFRHALLQVPEDALPPLPEGEYYRFQLIGLHVVDRDGAPLGMLEEVIETGANDVYRVRTPDGADLLLPALRDVVLRVDLDARRMVVDPPEWR